VPVPKKKTSTSKRDMRRSHDFLSKTNTIKCSHCGEQKKRHQVCLSCGTYKGREIIKQDEEK
jgi:large subunit ribosomal protein L32